MKWLTSLFNWIVVFIITMITTVMLVTYCLMKLRERLLCIRFSDMLNK